eukprot:TRINITY_DN8460_c0_g1_i2.p1 TRINITY_DN8460_c0_g1~~TRINITY_DN8460_c0_g1_i2.p1  ORF type:complete len:791 (-),score=205.55 TRINITY_DN8460_c0_g1_i2:310-2682(-)
MPLSVYHSFDLVEWDFAGNVLSPNASSWNQCDLWAPEVVYDNGMFYMYYAASTCSNDFMVNELARRIGVATSDSPLGPFVDIGQPLTQTWGIDAHFFKDPDTAKKYLFYSFLYEYLPGYQPSAGASVVADQLLEMTAVANSPDAITRGSAAWEDKDGDPTDGTLRYTNEGPTVMKRDGKYYAMFSGGSWDMPTYALGYATLGPNADILSHQGIGGPVWNKSEPPILKTNNRVEAPGHNAVTKAPNNVDDICVHHGRVPPYLTVDQRYAFVDRIYWNHDRMFMNLPTTANLVRPDLPLFADIFDLPDGPLSSDWKIISGTWAVWNSQAQQSDPSSQLAQVAVEITPLKDYVFEANIAFLSGTSDSLIGVVAFWESPNNTLNIWIEPFGGAVTIDGYVDGESVKTSMAITDSNFGTLSYHQLLITKNGPIFSVVLDKVNLGSLVYKALENLGGSSFQLQTYNASGLFDGIAITPFFEDTFTTPNLSWKTISGSWIVFQDSLMQDSDYNGIAIATRGQPTSNYEMRADVLWAADDGVTSKQGVVAAISEDASEAVIAGFNKNIWPLAQFYVQHLNLNTGEMIANYSVGLPRGFLYDQYHNVRVVKVGNAFSFFLDGRETFSTAINLKDQQHQVGLFTERSRASFGNCVFKWSQVGQNLLLNGGFETSQALTAENGSPWLAQGAVQVTPCCPYSGYQKLVSTANGVASQNVMLDAGNFSLRWFYINTDDSYVKSQVDIMVGQNSIASEVCVGEKWSVGSLGFKLATPQNISVQWSSMVKAGAIASVDDFFLFQN